MYYKFVLEIYSQNIILGGKINRLLSWVAPQLLPIWYLISNKKEKNKETVKNLEFCLAPNIKIS